MGEIDYFVTPLSILVKKIKRIIYIKSMEKKIKWVFLQFIIIIIVWTTEVAQVLKLNGSSFSFFYYYYCLDYRGCPRIKIPVLKY